MPLCEILSEYKTCQVLSLLVTEPWSASGRTASRRGRTSTGGRIVLRVDGRRLFSFCLDALVLGKQCNMAALRWEKQPSEGRHGDEKANYLCRRLVKIGLPRKTQLYLSKQICYFSELTQRGRWNNMLVEGLQLLRRYSGCQKPTQPHLGR